MLKINDVIRPPIEWDVLEDFSFNNEKSVKGLAKNPYILKGPVIVKHDSGIEENVRIAKSLDLFSSVTHPFTIPGINTRHKNLDIVIIRENTEGEYSGLEHEVYPGVIESIKVITRTASIRLAEYAFEHAFLSGRKKLTAIHKANIM